MYVVLAVVAAAVIALVPVAVAAEKEGAGAFGHYQSEIMKAYGIDIAHFKEQIPGGKAHGQPVTKYDLQQLLMGIKVELEHTPDKMKALEISMDHLEEFPDYYTRLSMMEEEAERDHKAKQGK
jgi:hypothetical protein